MRRNKSRFRSFPVQMPSYSYSCNTEDGPDYKMVGQSREVFTALLINLPGLVYKGGSRNGIRR